MPVKVCKYPMIKSLETRGAMVSKYNEKFCKSSMEYKATHYASPEAFFLSIALIVGAFKVCRIL